MSEATMSGETTVAPAETASAPSAAPVPTFGTSRGSGLARGKRASASNPAATKQAAPSDYQPTAIQVVNHQREYKNPFAPEPTVSQEAPAKVEAPAPAAPTAVAETTPMAAPAVADVQKDPEIKPELKILPPEEKPRPAQSWELGASEKTAQQEQTPAPRQGGRNDFRGERRDRDNREPRPEFRPRERREQNFERREEGGERREQRTFQPKPTAAVAEAKKSGFLGWLKGLFSGEVKEQPETTPNQQSGANTGENRQDGYRGGRHNHGRGGRNRGYRGENRGGQFGGATEGQSSEQGQGDHRFDSHRGGRRHHRGGRGRYRGDNRGGEQRPDGGSSS